jgi:uncharacterized membrane protein
MSKVQQEKSVVSGRLMAPEFVVVFEVACLHVANMEFLQAMR